MEKCNEEDLTEMDKIIAERSAELDSLNNEIKVLQNGPSVALIKLNFGFARSLFSVYCSCRKLVFFIFFVVGKKLIYIADFQN